MPARGRVLLFLSVLAGASPSAAQLGHDSMIVARDPMPWVPSRQAPAPDFRVDRGDLRELPGPTRNGLIAAVPIRENVTLGIGRFLSSAPRSRTHVEAESRPADVRRRERGVAAVGLSIRF